MNMMQLKSSILYKAATITWCIVTNLVLFISPNQEAASSFSDIPGLDKIGHLALFAILTWLSLKAIDTRIKRKKIRIVCVVLILYALGTELIQNQLSDRTGDIYDFLFDVLGIGMAYFIFHKKYNET